MGILNFILTYICVISHLPSDTTTEFWPGKDCPVDKDPSNLDDPNNVFSCKPDEECCTKNLKPACCAAMPTDMMVQDQITLWVPLAGRRMKICCRKYLQVVYKFALLWDEAPLCLPCLLTEEKSL